MIGKQKAPVDENTQSNKLDWNDRPDDVKKKIFNAWKRLSSRAASRWTLNGDDEKPYNICDIDEYKLIEDEIKASSKKKFHILDIGAGNFGFGRGLSKFLNNSSAIPDDIEVHIVGIRAEKNSGPEKIIDGVCVLHELGQFKVEWLFNEFECNQEFKNVRFDYIVSTDCFRHLVDPIGTFAQAYDILTISGGKLITKGYFEYTYHNKSDKNYFDWTESLLPSAISSSSKLFFSNKKLGNFSIITRRGNKKCEFPLSYIKVEESLEGRKSNASRYQVVFRLHHLDNEEEYHSSDEGEYTENLEEKHSCSDDASARPVDTILHLKKQISHLVKHSKRVASAILALIAKIENQKQRPSENKLTEESSRLIVSHFNYFILKIINKNTNLTTELVNAIKKFNGGRSMGELDSIIRTSNNALHEAIQFNILVAKFEKLTQHFKNSGVTSEKEKVFNHFERFYRSAVYSLTLKNLNENWITSFKQHNNSENPYNTLDQQRRTGLSGSFFNPKQTTSTRLLKNFFAEEQSPNQTLSKLTLNR